MLSTSMMTSGVAASPAQDALETSAVLVDQSLQADRNFCDMSDLLQVPKHTQPSASGLMDFDYPSLADPKIGLSSVTELGNIKKIPLPAELVEQFGHMQCNCMMGLFPEISRAWLSIDSDIFVWNYQDGTDLAYFDGLSEAILSVGLVQPRPGIFQTHIQYLLCLSTPVDIVLLGVSFSKPFEVFSGEASLGEMHLLPEPLFSIPTDNTHIMSIRGASNGRIFMAGKDGCLYELVYQAEDGWFSRKCYKVNHSQSKLAFMVPSFLNFSFADDDAVVQISIDDSRNILYTRSEKGTIQVYDLGEDGNGSSRVAAISLQTTVQNAALVAKTIDRSNFRPLVHLAAIPKSESTNVHLVAITQSGVRLYFTTCPFNNNRGRPYMLSMVHVRLPPGFSASAPLQRPTGVHSAYYGKGTMILAAAQTEDNDVLWTVTSDAFPFLKQLRETHEQIPIDGRTWAMAEIPSYLPQLRGDHAGLEGLARADPPLVVTQHMEPERKFVLINSQGSYLFNKFSPADQLRELLSRYGPDSEDVRSFFQLHKEQACATCLTLACNHAFSDQQVSESATRAFFLYGGDPEYNFNAPLTSTLGPGGGSDAHSNLAAQAASPGGPGFTPASVSTPYPNVAQQLQFASPRSGTSMLMGGGQEVLYSNKHRGLCLYLARILRPLWESRMVKEFPIRNGPGDVKQFLASRFNNEELNWILRELSALKKFVDTNSQFANPLAAEGFSLGQAGGHRSMLSRSLATGDVADDQTRRKYQAEAEAQENASMKQLQQLLTKACESLGLWKILCDHQFHIITSALTIEHQKMLYNMPFKSFVLMGKEISHALITSLINMYLDDNAATDAISCRLREVCPSLYSSEDEVYSKGNEKLKTARSAQTPLEREQQLREALEKYKQITTTLDLPTVCNHFAQVRFYRGIVDLTLTAAARRDPQGLALHYYRNGEPPEDTQGAYTYAIRMDCYKCITETLDYLLSTSLSNPHSPSVPKVPGPPPAADPNRLTITEAERYSEEIFELVLKSEDEMFHVALYDWLIQKNLSEKLLTIQSPFLEPYLKRTAGMRPDHLPMLDLLWKYYEKTKNYSAAAHILAKLADKHGTNLSLQQRREYLSRAIMCAKSSTQRMTTGTEGEFLHELEEKMEVTRLQVHIHDALSRLPADGNVQDALSQLNSQLLDITTLYGEFADRFDLSECKLAVIHCAGHDDAILVEALWQDIIERELQISSKNDARTQMKTLGNKLVLLGRSYGSSEKYFPTAFLLKYLERRCCELAFDGLDLGFVFRSMQEIGITVPRLHEMYDRLFKSKDPCWKAVRKPFHLLFVIHQLLMVFAESPSVVPAYEKRHFTSSALDSVASYLIELQAESTSDKSVGTLIAYYKDLQSRMERIL